MSQGTTAGSSRIPASAPVQGKEQRVTKQRLAVSAALDDLADFVSTQELHRILQERGTTVSLATSYRILQSLADDGLVDVLRNADGEAVYRRCAVTGHHHHLLCRNCGKAVEVEAPAVEAWAARIATGARLHRCGAHRGNLRAVPRMHSRISRPIAEGCRPPQAALCTTRPLRPRLARALPIIRQAT